MQYNDAMTKVARLVALMLMLILLTAPSGGRAAEDPGDSISFWTPSERIEDLWSRLVSPYLLDPLWEARDHYDAANLLMVPMHTAFAEGDEARMRQFSEHFTRATAALTVSDTTGSAGQYFYTSSRLVALSADANRPDMVPDRLLDLLYRKLKNQWLDLPVRYRYDYPNLQAAVDYKLNTPKPTQPYDRGLIDREFFTFAIAADVRHYERVTGKSHALSYVLDAILERANRAFTQEVVWGADGGWLFQPGVWSRHVEYAYAGRTEKVAGMKPLIVPGIGRDSSHSHRMPLWLVSLRDAYAVGSSEHEHYRRLIRGLETQLLGHVLEPPTRAVRYYRMRNYMDGTNGIFRWNYPTLGQNQGYGPFEMSDSLLLGWWSLLGSERLQEVYRRIAYQFPLPTEGIAVYTGPPSSRERHPTVAGFLTNGYAELVARLAAQ